MAKESSRDADDTIEKLPLTEERSGALKNRPFYLA